MKATFAGYAPGPYVATGWESLIVNDSQGNTIALAPGANYGLAIATSTARLLAASWEMRHYLRDLADAIREGRISSSQLADSIVEHDHELRMKGIE